MSGGNHKSFGLGSSNGSQVWFIFQRLQAARRSCGVFGLFVSKWSRKPGEAVEQKCFFLQKVSTSFVEEIIISKCFGTCWHLQQSMQSTGKQLSSPSWAIALMLALVCSYHELTEIQHINKPDISDIMLSS